jgi:ElaA protein
MNIRWVVKPFQELSVVELYEIMKLRLEIFVVEQNCPYQDADGKDLKSLHLMGYSNDGVLVAYCRILPAGISYAEVSIGRVVSSSLVRGSGARETIDGRGSEMHSTEIRKQLGTYFGTILFTKIL